MPHNFLCCLFYLFSLTSAWWYVQVCARICVCVCVLICDKKRNHQKCVMCTYAVMAKSNYFRFNGKGDFNDMNDG